MGDFNAQIGKIPNPVEMATGTFGLELRSDTLVEWATSRTYKVMNTMFQKKAGGGGEMDMEKHKRCNEGLS